MSERGDQAFTAEGNRGRDPDEMTFGGGYRHFLN